MSTDTPEPDSAPVPPAAPAPPTASAPVGEASGPPAPAAVEFSPPAEPDVPPVTASGLPNPHGLPEIAVERPAVAVGAAFAGGLVLAMILKRLGR